MLTAAAYILLSAILAIAGPPEAAGEWLGLALTAGGFAAGRIAA